MVGFLGSPIIVTAVFLGLTSVSLAEVIYSSEAVRATHGLPALNRRIRDHANKKAASDYVECAEVQEIERAFLCVFTEKRRMNLGLGRASIFAEGYAGTPVKTVLTQEELQAHKIMNGADGHDLQSADIIDFFERAEQACKKHLDACLNEAEKTLYKSFLLRLIREKQPFVVVAYPLRSGLWATLFELIGFPPIWYMIASHELLHAHYFLNSRYRVSVDNFWHEKVTESDKDKIKKHLKGYDVTNPLLLRNEFQAYVLMPGAEKNLLNSVIPKYRKDLMGALKQTPPLQVMPE